MRSNRALSLRVLLSGILQRCNGLSWAVTECATRGGGHIQ